MSEKVKFLHPRKSEFFSTLKKRVDKHFKEKNRSRFGDYRLYFKTFFYVGGSILFYLMIMLGSWSTPVYLLLATLLGLFIAFIGLNVCHDAIHGSYSSNPKVNKVFGYLFNLIGANAYMWNISHNIIHHSYTNIPGHDQDIESIPLLRLSPEQQLWKVHRFQHLYAFIFYGFASLSWVLAKDYVMFFKPKIGSYDNKNHPLSAYFELFGFKLVYYTLFLALPIIFLPFVWWQVLLGFLVMHAAMGFTLAIVFMLAHVVEGADYPMPDDKGNMQNVWAIHQMRTTANFARTSPITNFLCGGLNFQIEHHLFPKVSHVHYREISEIVKATAEEYGVPYNDKPTFLQAVQSHLRLLRALGTTEKPAVAIAH